MDIALQLVSNILIPASLFALLIVGFSLIYSVSRVMHVAHGSIAILAGYLFYFSVSERGFPIWLAVILVTTLVTVLGIVLNELIYERMRNQKAVSSAGILIATLSLLLIIQNGILAIFGAATKTFAPLRGAIHLLGPVSLSDHEIRILLLAPLLLLVLWYFLKRTRRGKALRAVSDNEAVAEVIGISAHQARQIVFGIASFLAAIAGILFAIEYGLEPGMATHVSVRMFYHAIVGGIGSVPGALVGTALMQTVYVLTGWYWNAGWSDLTEFFVMFAVLLIRPQGILGKKKRAL